MEQWETDECVFTSDERWSMYIIRPAESGLSCIVFITFFVCVEGEPRIKVSNGSLLPHEGFEVSISDTPCVVEGEVRLSQTEVLMVFNWIKLNNQLLIKIWNDWNETIPLDGSRPLVQQLKKLL